MSLAFVTTFNKKLYSSYAKRFVEEFENYSSKDISLYILFEGEVPNELFAISKNIYPIKLVSSKQNLFFKNFGKLQEAKGFKIHFFEENGKSMMTIKQDFSCPPDKNENFDPYILHFKGIKNKNLMLDYEKKLV